MEFTSTRIPYRQTSAFSPIALDYIDQVHALKPFFSHPPSLQGIQKAIEARKQVKTDRKILVQELRKQYEGVTANDKVRKNIESLLSSETFTVTTAHQNNIFSGPLYFIYKIVHAIKLADHLKTSFPQQDFVPVFYIGTEDADIEELNHIYLGGEKLTWETKQTGAVGRMKIDKGLLSLVERMEGQLSVLPNGNEVIRLLREHYKEGMTIQEATFRFVNHLFAEYGLIVLLPDNRELKRQMTTIMEDDLLHQTASSIVERSAEKLEKAGYKVQAHPREINLFYLTDDKRERIVREGTRYRAQGTGDKVQGTGHKGQETSIKEQGPSLDMDETQLKNELHNNPERFSPNVILRGLYQELILPNIAFIGGAGETAYWLQLKDLFDHYRIPFPVLVLRNSFMLVEKKWQEKIASLGFNAEDLFIPEYEIMNKLVKRESKNETRLNGSLSEVENLYDVFKKKASAVDSTLGKHVDALKTQTVYRLQELEKKMLRAEKRKFTDQQRQVHTIREHLFPGDGLQERRENLTYYYAKWGKEFIQALYKNSLSLEQEFVILAEK